MSELEEHLRSLAEPVLARHGAGLVELHVTEGRRRLIRVVADRPGGIDLETCAKVSSELSRMLDVEDPIEGRYMLEVSSPGLRRPLQGAEDFRRNVGRKVRLILDGYVREGVIESVDDVNVNLQDGESVALSEIVKAKILLPW